jgi:hypothetical protein
MVKNIVGALPYDDKAFQGNGPYVSMDATDLGSRVVAKYYLHDEKRTADAVLVISELLKDNPNLCPTFSMDTLKTKLEKRPWLIINGLAVCLAKNLEGGGKVEFKDSYFTEGLLKRPVRCSHGHLLERKLAAFWQKKYPNSCPGGADHIITSLDEVKELEHDIETYIQRQREKQAKAAAERERAQLGGGISPVIAAGVTGKVIAKEAGVEVGKKVGAEVLKQVGTEGGKKIGIELLRTFGVEGGKTVSAAVGKRVSVKVGQGLLKSSVGKSVALAIAKPIPFVSAVIGAGLGVYRLCKGEYARAAGEVVSGALACIPGPGTVLSFAVDGGLFATDVVEACMQKRGGLDLKGSYAILQIDSWRNPNPSERQVDFAYQRKIVYLRSDHLTEQGAGSKKVSTEESIRVTEARDFIYQKRGWIPGLFARKAYSERATPVPPSVAEPAKPQVVREPVPPLVVVPVLRPEVREALVKPLEVRQAAAVNKIAPIWEKSVASLKLH